MSTLREKEQEKVQYGFLLLKLKIGSFKVHQANLRRFSIINALGMRVEVVKTIY